MFQKIKHKAYKKLVTRIMTQQLPKYSDDEIKTMFYELRDRLDKNDYDEINTEELCLILEPLIYEEMRKRKIINV